MWSREHSVFIETLLRFLIGWVLFGHLFPDRSPRSCGFPLGHLKKWAEAFSSRLHLSLSRGAFLGHVLSAMCTAHTLSPPPTSCLLWGNSAMAWPHAVSVLWRSIGGRFLTEFAPFPYLNRPSLTVKFPLSWIYLLTWSSPLDIAVHIFATTPP